MKGQIVALFTAIALGAYSINTNAAETLQPTLADYKAGEKWVWKFKGMTSEGEIRANGIDTKEIVSTNGVLNMVHGNNITPLADIVTPEGSQTPRFHWPLKVGKKWKFEESWTSQDGTKGKSSQYAEVLSFKEEKVAAGKFMAYTIQYKGKITNSRGYSADTEEIFWYAPSLKTFIKLAQSQDDYEYIEELIEYYKPKG